MFKKIVSQLSFSPALVGQLGFYARRLRKEQATRRIGLIFVALALVVQSLVVFQAPEAANASSENDFIPGGLGTGSALSINNFLAPYDKNERHLKDIMNFAGITRAEIAAAKFSTVEAGTSVSYGFQNRAQSTAVPITDASGARLTTIYGRNMTTWGYKPTDHIYAFVGKSEKLGWFAIIRACGNLVTHQVLQPKPQPKPANIIASKSGINVTRGKVDATKVAARENDLLTYTVQLRNTGGTASSVAMKDDLSEVSKYAQLTDKGGGTYYASSKTLSWGTVKVAPGATITHSYSVRMNASLISTTTNCAMKNNFLDHSVTVPVQCSTPPANIIASKSAINVSQKNVDATKTTAKENDTITYTVQVKNTGGTAKAVTMKDNLSDVLEFAKLTSAGGGTLNSSTKELTWGSVNVKPGASVSRSYSVKINNNLINDSTKCSIVNNFMDKSLIIHVGCKTPPAEIVVTKTSANISQGNVDATTVTAQEDNRISFTLTAKNTGGTAKAFTFEDDISDVLEYAKVIDNGGSSFNAATSTLSWPAVTIEPGHQEVRTFSVQILSDIPATPKGISDGSSYDCRIENTFFEAFVVIPVQCPTPKVIEQVVPELPHTGPRENMLFAGIVLAIAVFFYLRSRQLATEVRLIRRDVNGGTI